MKIATLSALITFALITPNISSAEPKGEAHSPVLSLNEDLLRGWAAEEIDFKDADAVFDLVFGGLPDQVTVFPSENYYYWKLDIAGRHVWGNIRIPAGARDRGVISFGYFEFNEAPPAPGTPGSKKIVHSKFFTKADGVVLTKIDRHTYSIDSADKKVIFNLHQLSQDPPKKFQLREDEEFVQRTFDESGLQFILLYNSKRKYFLWVLNEEEGVDVPEHFREIGEDLISGRRTGFVFWNQDGRKTLASIRKFSMLRNDYYDGPFDQLADNYAEEVEIQKYMELAMPGIKGRIDKFGNYTDRERPLRVAISTYGNYFSDKDVIEFMKKAKDHADPYYYISRGGRVQDHAELRRAAAAKLRANALKAAGSQTKAGAKKAGATVEDDAGSSE